MIMGIGPEAKWFLSGHLFTSRRGRPCVGPKSDPAFGGDKPRRYANRAGVAAIYDRGQPRRYRSCMWFSRSMMTSRAFCSARPRWETRFFSSSVISLKRLPSGG